MRILFGSWPAYGHLFPMLPMIRAARRAGHDVLVSTGADMAPVLEGLGVPGHRSGVTLAESYARMPGEQAISELPPQEQPFFAAQHLFGRGAADRARDVLDLVEGWRPDLVVHDTLELGTPTAAAIHDVPHVTHGYGPMVPGSGHFADAIGAAIGAAGLPDPVPAVLAAPYLDVCPPGLRGIDPGPWADLRPLRPTPGEVPPGTELDLPDLPYGETVYVTLGTVMNQAPELFRAVLDGCSARAVNVVVTTGPDVDPAFLGELAAGVHVSRFLPQAAVLPLCRAVVSHAGAGTMLGALCHGLPQLCLPQGTDQPSNTDALLATGSGLALRPGEVTAESVAESLGRLLDEPSFRAAAQELQAQIDLMPDAATVLAGLAGS